MITVKVVSWHCSLFLIKKNSRRGPYNPSMCMDRTPNQEQTGGTTVRIGDCYIWAGIYYLDSSNDYREYLPRTTRSVPSPEGNLVMLDDKPHPGWGTALGVVIGALLISLGLLSLMRACG